MYTYTIGEDLVVHILLDSTEVDFVGPWGSLEGAENWATAFVNRQNLEVDVP